MKKLIIYAGILLIHWTLPPALPAAPTENYKAIPAFISENSAKPNVLIILDNSNSMDEDVTGRAVGSDHPTSRSEIARHAIKAILGTYGSSMRIGLMTYRQTNIVNRRIHNSPYYISFDPATYDPDGAVTPQDAETNTLRIPNPSDPTSYIYYDVNLPFYAGANYGTAYCYSTNFQNRPDPTPPITAGNMNQSISADNPYRCYTSKVGPHDVFAGHSHAGDAAAQAEYSGHMGNFSFGLTDSDVAAGMFQIGAQMMWQHVGPCWFSNSMPGGGMLHAALADPSTSHTSALEAKLATCQFATATDTPIRNGGFTPIYSTLISAEEYFEGNLTATYGGPQATPIQHSCQKNFIILVTDGLPTEDPNANGDFITPVVDQVTALRTATVTVDGSPTNFDIQTFVLGFALPPGFDGALDSVAVAGGTAVNGRAYYPDDESEIEAALNNVFLEILNRTSAGTAASVIASSRRGDGAVVQAVFEPRKTDGTNEVAWTGDVHALYVDSEGRMRASSLEGDGTQILESVATDNIITMCYDDGARIVRINQSATVGGVPDSSASAICSATDFPITMSSVDYLWSTGEWLADLTDTQSTTQRAYADPSPGRHIITSLDSDGDDLIDQTEALAFLPGSFNDSNAGLLQAGDTTEAAAIVNYIRGDDQTYRSRQIDYGGDGSTETWRLGDVVHSTPTVVAAPAEDFDLLYKDNSYASFSKHYNDRRQMVYIGANDGMLHAINGGWYDTDNKTFYKGKPAMGPDPATVQYDLGAEVWAYVPYNLLPHLKYLSGTDYGSATDDHIYYVDLKPRAFDARIFFQADGVTALDADHPGGWGTILVGGMRFGGGEITVDADVTDDGDPATIDDVDNRTLRSAIFILDITNPETAPKVLLEFTHADLGFTTVLPTPLKIGSDWYLLLGSGPHPANPVSLAVAKSTQAGKLFLINLKTMALVTDFGNSTPASNGKLELADANSFVSDLVAVDYDLDYNTDAIYFGTVSGSPTAWSGKIQRIRIQDQGGTTPTHFAVADWNYSTLFNTPGPVAAAPTIGIDSDGSRWVYCGTGRFYTRADADDGSAQSFYALKEPVDNDGTFNWGEVNSSDLVDVTAVNMYENYAASYSLFDSLSSDMQSSSGWHHDLAGSGERTLGQAALFGKIVTFTTYVPSTAVCTFEGTSTMYALYYGTGTAYVESVVGASTTDSIVDAESGETKFALLKSISLGVGLSITPSLHTGKYSGSKVYIQTSTGAILTEDEMNPGMVKSGKISWGER